MLTGTIEGLELGVEVTFSLLQKRRCDYRDCEPPGTNDNGGCGIARPGAHKVFCQCLSLCGKKMA